MTWAGFRVAVEVFHIGSTLCFQGSRGAVQRVETVPDATWEAMP